MKILILANNDVGLYKFRKELLEELVADGHKVYISLPNGNFIPQLEKIGCNYVNTDISRRGTNVLQDLKLMYSYKKILKTIQPNIVFTYTIKPNIYGGLMCSKLKIPYVVNITGLGTAVENSGILQLLTVNLYRCALRMAKTVFFQNKENEMFFRERKLAVGRHKMLPGSGVNLDYYKPFEYPKENTIDFLFVARIMKEKGIEQYLDAAKVVRKKYPNTRFHICGFCEQDYKKEIDKLHKDGTIIYHGLVNDMRDIYNNIHCVVHPTYYPEGLSNVLLEASASARPIITTNRSGCREVVEDGINGFIVEEKNTYDLINKLEKFIMLGFEKHKIMGEYGRKKVEKEFDRKIVIQKYLGEINNGL